MEGSSGVYKELGSSNLHASAPSSSSSSLKNGGNSSVHGEWGVPTFQHQPSISMEWTNEEQAILEEGLAQ